MVRPENVDLLLIEDSKIDRRVVTHQLSKVASPRFRVEEAFSLEQGQQKLRVDHFDVILLDLCLPDSQGLNGLESLAREFPAIPIVILTSDEDENLALRAFRSGAQDYLVKGQAPASLLKRVLLYAIERKHVDITLNQHRESLRAAQRFEMMGRIAGKVAHDFNNILNTVMGFADLALDDLQGHPSHEDLLEIKKAALRGVKLTKSVLNFSRRGSTGQSTSCLDDVVEGIQAALRLLLPAVAQLEIELGAGQRRIDADPIALEQVLTSLVLNAGEALRSHSIVYLRTGHSHLGRLQSSPTLEPGDYLTLEVEDHGTGMDEAHKNRMFDPFFTTKAQDGGTGLGLSKVVDFVRVRRGGVRVDTQPNRGTRVTLFLPEVKGESSEKDALAFRRTIETAIVLSEQLFSESEYAEVFEERGLTLSRFRSHQIADFVCDSTVRIIFVEDRALNEDVRTWAKELRSRWLDLRFVVVATHSSDDAMHKQVWPDFEILWRPFSPNSLKALLRTPKT